MLFTAYLKYLVMNTDIRLQYNSDVLVNNLGLSLKCFATNYKQNRYFWFW